ncbi:MAG: hypothetical protein M3Y71_16505 [Actinomycetota bacterium]|nr:hypothetical protein [Actinomycetota bacterium]
MTTSHGHVPSGDSALFAAMLRTALLPSAVCGLAAVVALWVTRGPAGLLGSLTGVAVALVFFVAGLAVMRRLSNGDPMILMVAALAVFLGQLVFLGAVILVLGSVSALDGVAVGLGVLVVALAWQVFQIIAFLRSRRPVFDPPPVRGGMDAAESVE